MIKVLVIFCFSLILFASDKADADVKKEHYDKKIYMIQLFSDKRYDYAKKLLNKVPPEFRDDTRIYKVKDYYKGRYGKSESYSKIKPYVNKIQKAGFKGAFIVTTTFLEMKKELTGDEKKVSVQKAQKVHIDGEKKIITHKTAKAPIVVKDTQIKSVKKEIPKTVEKKPVLDRSVILRKAKDAYIKGDNDEAVIYYEKAFFNGFADDEAKNNLCYLYGKKGALMKAKDIINGEEYQSKLIYSYAYGEVESNQKDYYDHMHEYIKADKNGKLTMLTGYYYEMNKNIPKAELFYKKAYEINPANIYNIYAYAHLFDIKKDIKALKLYKDILKSIDRSHPLYQSVAQRVKELEK